MKKMNNYEAPKAEVIELVLKKDVMQFGWDTPTVTELSGDSGY